MTRVRVDAEVAVGGRVALDERDSHHLVRVLRCAVGTPVVLVDAAGGSWRTTVAAVEGSRVELAVEASLPSTAASPRVALTVWLPLLKGGRTDDLIRQLTELGATRIVPFMSSRAVSRVEGAKAAKKRDRWQVIAREATRQCGRTDEPVVEAVTGLPTVGPGVFLWEAGGPPARSVLPSVVDGHRLSVLVGPEGGLSEDEATQLRGLGWVPASLGPRILRAETAVVAAAVLALHALGEGGY